MIYKGCIFLGFEVKQHVSALYGHHQVLSIEVSLYKLREKGCDVEICHQIIVRICLYTSFIQDTSCVCDYPPTYLVHFLSVIQTSQLMLYREIMAVCSEIHTKHINTAVWAERGIVEC